MSHYSLNAGGESGNLEILEDVFDNIKDRIHGPLGDFEPCVNEDVQTAAKTRAFNFLRASPVVLPDCFLSWFANVCATESEASQSLWHKTGTSGGAHFFLTPSKTLQSGKEILRDVRAIGNFLKMTLPATETDCWISRFSHAKYSSANRFGFSCTASTSVNRTKTYGCSTDLAYGAVRHSISRMNRSGSFLLFSATN